MNKFLNRRVKASKEKRLAKAPSLTRELDVLQEACNAYSSLNEVRKKARRSQMYALENQWGDIIKNPDTGTSMTEEEYIKRQGKVPLKNNVIRPIVKNIDGQFRNSHTKPVCIVRDQRESKIGEMMSIAVEYSHQLNEMIEIDAACLNSLMLSGICVQRIEYGFNPTKQLVDAWVYPCNTYRVFFNTDIEDPRGWDVRMVGELFDMPISDIVAAFSKSPSDRDKIWELYGNKDSYFSGYDGLQGFAERNTDFFNCSRPDLQRVILVWKKESRDALFCTDTRTGKWWYDSLSSEKEIKAENDARISEGLANGMEREDVLLVEYEYSVEQYWYYRYMTPTGHVLQEGRSPYWHKQHNYVIDFYPLVNGKIFNFVEDFIDQQRYINRTLTMIDFIRSSSAKGLLIVDEDAFQGMSREQIVDEYVRYNGVLFVRLKAGQNLQNIVHQYNGSAAVNGDFELIKLQLDLINQISGVSNAMQGQPAPSGTPSSLYMQQAQNSSNNIKGLLDSMKNFRVQRDNKLMKTIQQYYTSARYIDLAGSDYSVESKWYDPEKVQDSDIDVSITEGINTPVYQMVLNDFLMDLYKSQAINVKQLLENSSLPFASRILESIKRDENEMAQAQQEGRMANLEGVAPDLVQGMDQFIPQQN